MRALPGNAWRHERRLLLLACRLVRHVRGCRLRRALVGDIASVLLAHAPQSESHLRRTGVEVVMRAVGGARQRRQRTRRMMATTPPAAAPAMIATLTPEEEPLPPSPPGDWPEPSVTRTEVTGTPSRAVANAGVPRVVPSVEDAVLASGTVPSGMVRRTTMLTLAGVTSTSAVADVPVRPAAPSTRVPIAVLCAASKSDTRLPLPSAPPSPSRARRSVRP